MSERVVNLVAPSILLMHVICRLYTLMWPTMFPDLLARANRLECTPTLHMYIKRLICEVLLPIGTFHISVLICSWHACTWRRLPLSMYGDGEVVALD